ncbi:aspartic peptidase domain-containing protein [Massariosphaeria phaeospora]|uniref:Aspartic peptidase domain-containing protein n=1 Tax=Massariosphaeria phaeospora TaxID=100035 RepID=A0A7C8M183_9PLEO|nr:aspartic peptidase domain-containing protein [Massariosphaeria phaeospora]
MTYFSSARGNPRGVVALPIRVIENTSTPIHRRQDGVPLRSIWTGTYVVNVGVGEPAQPMALELDTLWAYTWLNPNCTTTGSAERDLCRKTPQYDPRKSLHAIDRPAWTKTRLDYDLYTSMEGLFYTDTLRVGPDMVERYSFIVNSESRNLALGRLGLGMWNMSSPNLLEKLYEQSFIDSKAFSLDIRSVDEQGSLVLGGLDTKKYKCKLQKIPLNSEFRLELTDIGFSAPNQDYKRVPMDITVTMAPDAATVLSTFPESLFHTIGQNFPRTTLPQKSQGQVYYTIPCDDIPEGTLDFTFIKTTRISVPLADFVLYEPSIGQCILGMAPMGQSGELFHFGLGTLVLQSIYLVVDVDNKNMWIGQSDNCGSSVVQMKKGEDSSLQVEGCSCKGPKSKPKPKPKPGAAYSLSPHEFLGAGLFIVAVSMTNL